MGGDRIVAVLWIKSTPDVHVDTLLWQPLSSVCELIECGMCSEVVGRLEKCDINAVHLQNYINF